ncbi:MAG: replicative DNA helicase [Anaerolineae bacterium]|nr:MAG: replicative DNA helicase [Anaerolineae bacterium]
MTQQAVLFPHSKEAEKAVLGSMMVDPDAVVQVRNILAPEDFYDELHQAIYRAMCDAWDNGEPVDYYSVGERVPDAVAYLTGIMAEIPSGLYGDVYAAKVKRYAELRRYLRMGIGLVERAHNSSNPDELYAWLREQLQHISFGRAPDEAVLLWDESFELYNSILDKRAQEAALPPEERATWEWPWASWNRLMDPIEPGMLAVISAGDGIGKTVYAECIAEHWAQRGHKVVFVHFELNRELMLDRRTARHTGIPRRVLKSGNLTLEQLGHIEEVRRRLLSWTGNITYLHTPGWTMAQVVRELERLRFAGLCDAVVVDYLEKAAPSQKQVRLYNSQYQREANDVEQLKNFGESAGVRMVLLSQLSKEGKDLPFDMLTRTKIRGAGEKTEKANFVLLLHRERMPDGETDASGHVVVEPGGYSRTVRVRLDKNTMGVTGQMEQFFVGETFSVFDLRQEASHVR